MEFIKFVPTLVNGANLGEHVNDQQLGVHTHDDESLKLDSLSNLLEGAEQEHHEGCMQKKFF